MSEFDVDNVGETLKGQGAMRFRLLVAKGSFTFDEVRDILGLPKDTINRYIRRFGVMTRGGKLVFAAPVRYQDEDFDSIRFDLLRCFALAIAGGYNGEMLCNSHKAKAEEWGKENPGELSVFRVLIDTELTAKLDDDEQRGIYSGAGQWKKLLDDELSKFCRTHGVTPKDLGIITDGPPAMSPKYRGLGMLDVTDRVRVGDMGWWMELDSDWASSFKEAKLEEREVACPLCEIEDLGCSGGPTWADEGVLTVYRPPDADNQPKPPRTK